MSEAVNETSRRDEKLFSSLLGEIICIQEMLDVLEGESVTVEEAVGLVSGIQRDIIQLYRAAA